MFIENLIRCKIVQSNLKKSDSGKNQKKSKVILKSKESLEICI